MKDNDIVCETFHSFRGSEHYTGLAEFQPHSGCFISLEKCINFNSMFVSSI